jgi:predicted alternative tryptophan synthase beta-subunit
MLPSSLENKVIKCVLLSLGHAGSEKYIAAIAHAFYVKKLGRKVRKILSCGDICQRVKHANRSYEIESRIHLPKIQGTYAPWIFMASFLLGAAVYGTF